MKVVNVTPRVSRAKCPIVLGVLFAIFVAAGSFAADRVGSAQYDARLEAAEY